MFPEVIEAISNVLKGKKKSLYADAIIQNSKGEILLVLRGTNTKVEPRKWGLPGGHVDEGETPEQAVKRETFEETGLEVVSCQAICEKKVSSGTIYYFSCIIDESNTSIVLDNSEHYNYAWFDKEAWNKEDLMFDLKDFLNETIQSSNHYNLVLNGNPFQLEAYLVRKSEKLEGGLADNLDLEDVIAYHIGKRALKEDSPEGRGIKRLARLNYRKGLEVESEHTDDSNLISEITLDHLKEDYNYYVKLEGIEKSIETITKAFNEGLVSEQKYLQSMDLFYKAKRNYQVGEISQTTGFKKISPGVWVDPKTGKQVKKDDSSTKDTKKDDSGAQKNVKNDVSKYSDKELLDHAKNTSTADLEEASQGANEKLRTIANKELARREKEESFESKDEKRASKLKKSEDSLDDQEVLDILEKSYQTIKDAYEIDKVSEDQYLESLHTFEKAKKDLSKLKKLKKLVTKDGKVFLQTFYVKTGETEIDEKDKNKIQETSLLEKIGSIAQGENVVITNKGKSSEGQVSGFSFNEKSSSFWVGIDSGDGKVKYTQLTDKTKIDFVEKKAIKQISEEDAVIDSNGFKIISNLGGSTGAIKVEKDGKFYVKKTGNSPEHLANEVRSLKYFDIMGVPVPKVFEYHKGEAVYIEWVEGDLLKDSNATAKAFSKIKKYFAAHAVMANHDVVGANYDNIIVDDEGNPMFIDVGGSMEFRAQGSIKQNWKDWSSTDPVTELKTMLDPSVNFQSANVFSSPIKITQEEILSQLKVLKKKALDFESNDGIKVRLRIDKAIKELESSGVVSKTSELEEAKEAKEPKAKDTKVKKTSDPVYKQNREDILDLYSNDIKTARINNRPDIVKFYEDFAENFALTQDETINYLSMLDKMPSDASSFAQKNNLNSGHIAAIQQHISGSSTLNGLFGQLVKNKIDQYNISTIRGGEISFNKEEFEFFKNKSGTAFAKARLIVDAFIKAKNSEAHISSTTVYRGLGIDNGDTLFDVEDIIIPAGVQSCSKSIEASFTKNTKITISSAEGLYIKDISSYDMAENEVILKPFSSIHIFHKATYSDEDIKTMKKEGITEKAGHVSRTHVKAEKPGFLKLQKRNIP